MSKLFGGSRRLPFSKSRSALSLRFERVPRSIFDHSNRLRAVLDWAGVSILANRTLVKAGLHHVVGIQRSVTLVRTCESRDTRLVPLLACHFQDLVRAFALGLNADAI
jgi:hypothetical protein